MVQLTCSRGVPQLDVINRCIAVLLVWKCSHVVGKVGTGVPCCWDVIHDARHHNEEKEEEEHHIEHEKGVQRHELHSLAAVCQVVTL